MGNPGGFWGGLSLFPGAKPFGPKRKGGGGRALGPGGLGTGIWARVGGGKLWEPPGKPFPGKGAGVGPPGGGKNLGGPLGPPGGNLEEGF